jgi:hypothetical protein
MRTALQRCLDSPRVTILAPLTTLAIGLFFVFVWAPHPWGWRGIDQYDQLARELARGEPFSTTDVPWGYTYYLAACLKLFGERTWVPVTIQVVVNAFTPLLVFMLARPAVGHRIASLAAWITAVFSFNTVYASTQSSDSICTLLFLLSIACFVRGHVRSSLIAFAAAGAISGVVPQFRPNMILLPPMVIAGYALWPPRGRRRLIECGVFIAAMTAMLLPWIVRNYHYTNTLLPTSTHGGIQLWYGTLQTGPYLESRAHNPRYIFASPAFDYTSLEQSVIVTTSATSCVPQGAQLQMAYRTNRDAELKRVLSRDFKNGRYEFEIPAQLAPTTIDYFFEAGGATTPRNGNTAPFIYFVSKDHLGDLDTANQLLDIFDIVRMARLLAWQEAPPPQAPLDLTGDGRIDRSDLAAAIAQLVPETPQPFAALETADDAAIIRLKDGSHISVPRDFNGRHTDLSVDGDLAGTLVSRNKRFAALHEAEACPLVEGMKVNDVFYRREPHEMARYTALALDNIRRDPAAFAMASAYRMVRLFIIRGTDDRLTTFQFPLSRLIFNAALVVSLAYFAIFVAGVVIAWRRRSPFLYALIPIVYVPLTICFVLTNMRYTITVQPLMFVFVAIAAAAALKIDGRARNTSRM